MQGELAVKNIELATASQEAEKLLKDISENTAIAEVEKGKVAIIVDQVSTTAAVRRTLQLRRLDPLSQVSLQLPYHYASAPKGFTVVSAISRSRCSFIVWPVQGRLSSTAIGSSHLMAV